MKKLKFVLFIAAIAMSASCKKCQTCDCYKNGIVYEESECAKSSDIDEYFNRWKYETEVKNNYDYCTCRYD